MSHRNYILLERGTTFPTDSFINQIKGFGHRLDFGVLNWVEKLAIYSSTNHWNTLFNLH